MKRERENDSFDLASNSDWCPTPEEISQEPRERCQLCSLCGQHYSGYGNNAYPANYGRCCDICYWMIVLPARHLAVRTGRRNF